MDKNFWKKSGKHQWYSGRKETTIWEFDKPKKNGDHPTMKPNLNGVTIY